jgi:outer membrane protein TolC
MRTRLVFASALLFVAWQSESARPLTLDAALQRTVDRNLAIQKARLDLERATGRRLVFRSVAFPDAIIGAVGGDQGGNRAGQKSNTPFGFGYGGFIQPLFNAAIPASLRRGNIEVLIAEQRLNMAMVEQLYSARVAFYSGVYNRSLTELGQQQREHLQGITDTQKARYESGLAQRGMFIGAEMQTRDVEPRIAAADRGYQGAALQLADIMGDDLTGRTPLPRLESDLTFKSISLDVDATAAAAMDRRADLKLARLLVRAANEEERIMEAAYYPALNATVGGEYIPVSGVRRQSEGSPKRSDDVISSELREGVAYSWRVIDNGKVTGAVRQRRSAREINELLLHKMEGDIPRDLARIRNNLDAIARNHASLAQATAAADQTTSAVNENLSGGVTTQLESRLAENASLEIRTELLTLAYQQKLALAELDRVAGRYFQFSDDRSQNLPSFDP